MDGRNPQDKGDSKRHGINTKASVSSLRKTAKKGGRKGQLAHWLANMKAGKRKKKMKEEAMTAADAGIPQDTKNMGPSRLPKHILRRKLGLPINMTDRRRKKTQPPVLLKQFRKYFDG